jgi:hypothetical protein
METTEMRFLRAVAVYRTWDRKCNEDIADELGIADISTVIKELSK